MDDTISRQAAIDSFPEDALAWDISDGYIAPHYVRKILETLPSAQPEQRWIPVTERLPGEDDYRPCYGYDDGAVWWVNDIGQMGLGWYYSSTGKWAYYDESDRCDKYVGNVVAWMPLPEPYREEGQDD